MRITTIRTAAALMAAAGIVAAGVTAAQASPAHHGHTSCAVQLAAMRTVSRQAGTVVGSRHIEDGVLSTGPGTWARELRRAGLAEVARTAAAIRDRKSDELFVLALTSAAAADLQDAAARKACRG